MLASSKRSAPFIKWLLLSVLAGACQGSDGQEQTVEDMGSPLPPDLGGMMDPKAPQLASVVPQRGTNRGGTLLRIRGDGFISGPGLSVTVDGIAATQVQWRSAQELVARTPADSGRIGDVPVRVRNPDGKIAEWMQNFTYFAGNPVFGTATLATSSDPHCMVTDDLNGDGKADLAIALADASPNHVEVQLGKGDGTFGPAATYVTEGKAACLYASDVNGDHFPDLVIMSSSRSEGVGIALNKGDGSFGPALFQALSDEPTSLTIADFDNDGYRDIAAGLEYAGKVAVLFARKNSGRFEPPVYLKLGPLAGCAAYLTSGPLMLAAADVNSDGNQDIVTTQICNTPTAQVAVLPGKGDGTFGTPVPTPLSGNLDFIAVADFDHDGKPDVAVSDFALGSPSQDKLYVMRGQGDGTFGDLHTYAVGQNPSQIIVGDWDGDGHTDLAVGGYQLGEVSILRGRGNGEFYDPLIYGVRTQSSSGRVVYSIAAADFDGDGALDLVANGSPNSVQLLFGSGDGRFVAPLNSSFEDSDLPGGPRSGLFLKDFFHDGKLDWVVIDSPDRALHVMSGQPDGRFVTRFRRSLPSSLDISYYQVADFDGNGELDVVGSPLRTGSMQVALGQSDGSFRRDYLSASASAFYGVELGDVNGDKKPDLIVLAANAMAPSVSDLTVLLGQGDGTFMAHTDNTLSSGSRIVALDLDGDVRTDIVQLVDRTMPDTHTLTTFVATADGKLEYVRSYSFPSYTTSLASADVNGDGKRDLLVGGATDIHVLLGADPGVYMPGVDFKLGKSIHAMGAADWNGDGRIDLAVSTEDTLELYVLYGKGDGTFAPAEPQLLGSRLQPLLAEDVNRDGLLDITGVSYFPYFRPPSMMHYQLTVLQQFLR